MALINRITTLAKQGWWQSISTFSFAASVSSSGVRSGNTVAVSSGQPVSFLATPTLNSSYNGGSAYFNGSSYLKASYNSLFDFGTGSFTVECWVFVDSSVSNCTIVGNYMYGPSNVEYGWNLGITASRLFEFRAATSGGGNIQVLTSSATVTPNTWYHLAVVRDGSSNAKLYVNGVSVNSSTTFTNNIAYNRDLYVGISGLNNNFNTNSYYKGNISNIRIIKGSAVYTGDFTPPTSNLQATVDTSLLLNLTNVSNGYTFLDNSSNNITITKNGSVVQTSRNPFGPNGWSGYFSNATNDYLTIPYNSQFSFGAGSFTVELWVYFSSVSTVWTFLSLDDYIANTSYGWHLYVDVNTKIRFEAFNNGGGNVQALTSSTTPVANTWYHVAVVRSSNTASLYINGSRESTSSTFNNDITYNTSLVICGGKVNGVIYQRHNGYISNIRIVKGTAVYDPTQTSITPPTAPLTAITNTSLLTLQDNRFKDNSTNNFTLTPTGSPQIQPFSPFAANDSYNPALYGGSGYFSGTSTDYLTFPSSASTDFGTGDFTIEFWAYPTATESYKLLYVPSSSVNHYFGFKLNGSVFNLNAYNISQDVTSSGVSITLNQWVHCAFVRSGTTLYFYINGVAAGSGNFSSSVGASTGTAYIGRSPNYASYYYAGYLSNFRIVKGLAVYTGAFAPPTSPVTLTSNGGVVDNNTNPSATQTSLLLNFANGGVMDGSNKNNVTATSSISQGLINPFGPLYTYKWYKNGSVISGATSNIYSIASTSGSTDGNYYCKVSSGNLSVPTETIDHGRPAKLISSNFNDVWGSGSAFGQFDGTTPITAYSNYAYGYNADSFAGWTSYSTVPFTYTLNFDGTGAGNRYRINAYNNYSIGDLGNQGMGTYFHYHAKPVFPANAAATDGYAGGSTTIQASYGDVGSYGMYPGAITYYTWMRDNNPCGVGFTSTASSITPVEFGTYKMRAYYTNNNYAYAPYTATYNYSNEVVVNGTQDSGKAVYMFVGGGGGAGGQNGGSGLSNAGSAGGTVLGAFNITNEESITVTIGAGGAITANGSNTTVTSTSLGTITAKKGQTAIGAAGDGDPTQGYPANQWNPSMWWQGVPGAGACGYGNQGGRSSNISGTETLYACGGGGEWGGANNEAVNTGHGGNGWNAAYPYTGMGLGQSGVVFFRIHPLKTANVTGSGSVSTVTYNSVGYKVIKFTGSGTLSITNTSPTITSQPTNATASYPANYSFSIAIDNNVLGTISYQWYRNGSAISGATSSTLSEFQLGVNSYYCVVTNTPGGSVTSSTVTGTGSRVPHNVVVTATGTTNAGATISDGTVTSSAASLVEGDGLSLSVAYDSYPASTVQWYKNSSIINGQTSTTLALTNVSTSDAGSYTCVITNSQGSVTTSACTVTVATLASLISINSQPTASAAAGDYYTGNNTNNITAYTTKNVTLSIAASSSKSRVTLSYLWTTGSTSSTATVTPAVDNVSGTVYTCSVYANNGSRQSAATVSSGVTVKAVTPLAITSQPVYDPNTYTINFAAQGTNLTYKWYKNSVLDYTTNLTPNYEITSSGTYYCIVQSSATSNSVTSNSVAVTLALITDVLIVAGGGGGGYPVIETPTVATAPGGGGGGQVKTRSSVTLAAGSSYTIVVGGGGAAAATGSNYGGLGSNSSITGTSLTDSCSGGGGAGQSTAGTSAIGTNGGNGGGATGYGTSTTSTPVIRRGGYGTQFPGGSSSAVQISTQAPWGWYINGGGGGGASEQGLGSSGNPADSWSYLWRPDGGYGLQWSKNGQYYGGGGSGVSYQRTGSPASYYWVHPQTAVGGGGYTYGSNGALANLGTTAGTANTGGGGAGGQSGGSGVVVIAYTGNSAKATGGTITYSGGVVYHSFLNTGSSTFTVNT